MADDIDDLLDEIETKFIKNSTTEHKNKTKRKCNDDLQTVIDDLNSIPLSHGDDDLNLSRRKPVEKRCFPTFIAGTYLAMGCTNSTLHKACDALRCLKCDFKVTWFDNFSWTLDTDYLFLRNNVPDFSRLRSKLKPKKGSRAYACQCEYRSIDDVIDVKLDSNLKWICGKHF